MASFSLCCRSETSSRNSWSSSYRVMVPRYSSRPSRKTANTAHTIQRVDMTCIIASREVFSQEVPDTERVRNTRARRVGGAFGPHYSPGDEGLPTNFSLTPAIPASQIGVFCKENEHDEY